MGLAPLYGKPWICHWNFSANFVTCEQGLCRLLQPHLQNCYRPQTKFGAMFLHLCVILFTLGGSALEVGCILGGGLHPGEGVCIQGGICIHHRIRRDTANVRAVRILLECILVYSKIIVIQNVLAYTFETLNMGTTNNRRINKNAFQ